MERKLLSQDLHDVAKVLEDLNTNLLCIASTLHIRDKISPTGWELSCKICGRHVITDASETMLDASRRIHHDEACQLSTLHSNLDAARDYARIFRRTYISALDIARVRPEPKPLEVFDVDLEGDDDGET